MLVRNYSESTLHRREKRYTAFYWCGVRSAACCKAARRDQADSGKLSAVFILLSARRMVNVYPQVQSQSLHDRDIKQFFKWLTQENYLLYNPASELIVITRQSHRTAAVYETGRSRHLVE
jgi:hypothetical protein